MDNSSEYRGLIEANIKAGLDMISKRSCIIFSYSSRCQKIKEDCELICTHICEEYKHADDKKCKKCFEPYKKCDKCTFECRDSEKIDGRKCKNKKKTKECKKYEECKKCKKSCKDYEEKYEACKGVCEEKCLKPKIICERKCKVVTLPFIRFFYNRNKNNSDFYFNGSTTLHKEEVYNMEIDVSCNKKPGCIAKKVLMYLGLIPTVRREDRNVYITVNESNIKPEYIKQYSRLYTVFLHNKYDYSSIGHFSDNYGAKSDEKTYVRKWLDDSRVFLTGQEVRPVFSDLKWLHIQYCKDHFSSHVLCDNNGYAKSDGSFKCECPNGYTGDFCDELEFTGPLCPDNLINIKDSQDKHPLAFYSKTNCSILLTAPEGKRIRINVEALNCTSKNPCFENDCLQIKYNSDMTPTGLCLCGTLQNTTLLTDSNKALIQYTGKDFRHYAFIFYQLFNK
uniref:EGF-like domain-containing protein n=1 Tax=Strongyloides papillosus TaxID=174720 RepID=A0A0N5C011_STREA